MKVVLFNQVTNTVPATPVAGVQICTANFNRTKLVIKNNSVNRISVYPIGIGPFSANRLGLPGLGWGFLFTALDDQSLVVAEWWGSALAAQNVTAQITVMEELYFED